MTRQAHLVGNWPGRDPEHAMESALESLAPFLARMTDGETGDRRLWIAPAIEKFRANPDVEIVKDDDWSDYDRITIWKVRDGVRLDPANIRLYYALAFENSFPSFRVLRERYGRPDLRFQVSTPSPLDLAISPFGDAAFEDPSILDACTEATAEEVRKIFGVGGDEVVFQIETVVGSVAVAKAGPYDEVRVAGEMAANFSDLVSRSPEGARFGAHLCLGDFHHKAFDRIPTVRPLVLLANAIVEAWPDGRTLEYVHIPFAAAEQPPTADESFYEPLRELSLPEGTRLIAGFQHELLSTEEHCELLARIERLSGGEVDIAAACGLGRRETDEEAFKQMRETANLLQQGPAADRGA